MLADLAVGVPRGPPPQAVLEKRPWWTSLIVLLGVTSIFQFTTLDVVGGMLTALMLFLACMMITDGMAEMHRCAVAFSMLSMLCLFFDMVPLLSSVGGRSEVTVEPVSRVSTKNELRITYETIIKTTPFFDNTQGYVYNGGSVVMILSPVAMLLGAYLAGQAHVELQGPTSSELDRDWPEARVRRRRPALGTVPSSPVDGSAATLLRFSGPSHRLEPD
ncbi:unnamed protein product [Effrenium voratum]|uniref:Uncharacterized protein n=1 Tax=Effrenium voratum TaxID=2562239 RepID=A0AA36I7I8_9DINO|nr:unnamed protein product [Effrenium voratum]CAJ1419875.1 unnamed protein product [Effrenium voratum]